MPGDLPLGNGDFLVTFDARYQLRDIFYPNVGLENHTVGEPSRFGIWIDGQFAWTGDDGWERHINYEHETLVGDTDLVHAKLGVSLHFRDAVDFDRNLYFKEVTVEDTSGKDRQVRLFQHFDAHLLGNDTGDSAYYDPRCQAVVHYKGRRYFLISGSSGGSAYGLSSFAIGQKDAPGKEGTWRDAEDGELSRNPVAQGSIDSVGMVAVSVPAKGSATGRSSPTRSTWPDTARSRAGSSFCAASSSRARATCFTNTTRTARWGPRGTHGPLRMGGSSCRSRRTRPVYPFGRSGSTTSATATSSSFARSTASSSAPAPTSWPPTASRGPRYRRRRSTCGKSDAASTRSRQPRSGRASRRRATSPSRSASTSWPSVMPWRRRRSAMPRWCTSGTRIPARSSA